MVNDIQRNVVKERKERKRRFVAALALAGMRQSDFADKHDIDPGHLSKVLNGERDSLRLITKVEAFIVQHLGAA